MKFSLSILTHLDCVFDVVFTMSLLYPSLSMFSPMLSSRNFIVLCFTLTYDSLQVSFCEGCKVCVYTHFFPCGCPVFPAPFVEENIFVPLYFLYSFVKDQLTIFSVGLLLGSLFCSTDLFVYYFTTTYCLYYCSFILSLEVM